MTPGELGGKWKKERVAKQKILKGCYQGQNVAVVAILESLEFKNFFSTNHSDQQYFSVFHGHSTLKSILPALNWQCRSLESLRHAPKATVLNRQTFVRHCFQWKTVYLVSNNHFTRHFKQYRNKLLSLLHQPQKTPSLQNTCHELLSILQQETIAGRCSEEYWE